MHANDLFETITAELIADIEAGAGPPAHVLASPRRHRRTDQRRRPRLTRPEHGVALVDRRIARIRDRYLVRCVRS